MLNFRMGTVNVTSLLRALETKALAFPCGYTPEAPVGGKAGQQPAKTPPMSKCYVLDFLWTDWVQDLTE